MLEKKIEAKLREAARERGGKAYKWVSPGNDGVPDRLVVLPDGAVGFVELKQKGGKPTPLQEKQLRFLRDLGMFVAVLDDAGDIPAMLDGIRNHRYAQALKGAPK